MALLRDAVRTLYAPQNHFGTVLEQEERIVTAQTVETTVKKAAKKHTASSAPETPTEPLDPEEPTTPAPEPAPPTPPDTPEPDPAPTDIDLAQSVQLNLMEGAAPTPTPTQLVLTSATTAGQLSCTDVATAPRTANTCTYSGGNGLITVASDGTVTYRVGTYSPGSLTISVTATDQAGNAYTQTLALNHSVQSP